LSLHDALPIYAYVDLVAEGLLELVHAEVAALEHQVGGEAGAADAAGELGLAAALEGEGDRPGLPVQGEVAGHLVAAGDGLDRRALERELGELLDVEEVRAAQVLVALGVVGVHALRLDGQLERRLARRLLVDAEAAGEVVESAVDPAQ